MSSELHNQSEDRIQLLAGWNLSCGGHSLMSGILCKCLGFTIPACQSPCQMGRGRQLRCECRVKNRGPAEVGLHRRHIMGPRCRTCGNGGTMSFLITSSAAVSLIQPDVPLPKGVKGETRHGWVPNYGENNCDYVTVMSSWNCRPQIWKRWCL